MSVQHIARRPARPRLPHWLWLIGGAMVISAGAFGAGFMYNYPPINWRIVSLGARFRDLLKPPPETIPTPSGPVAAAPTFAIVPATATPAPTARNENEESGIAIVATPTSQLAIEPSLPLQPTPFIPQPSTDLPRSFKLTGARQEYQLLNNCAPATLAAYLTYWGWQGAEPLAPGKDVRWQKDIAAVVKPIQRDYNVMAYELADYAADYAGLNAVVRYGGDIDTVRRFVANGIPVMIERGFREEEHKQAGEGWMGHYGLITGYDDDSRAFLLQDSFKGPNYWRSYNQIMADWQTFNYLYLIVYPTDRAAGVLNLLGPDADETTNYLNALAKAQAETQSLPTYEGQAFAWFNAGTSLNLLGRYEEAALAYDQARSYNVLPWRMLWYQTGLYRAYYQAGRYDDVIALADSVLNVVKIEESYYWRGWARYSQADVEGAAA
ncbi:MAG: C39 family peptidase, partial [Chloroflexi bacterium]|nr:C39 family peptidase [Chloroflexota bacterium]